MESITPPVPLVNYNKPNDVDDVCAGDVMMSDRLRKLLHRRRELVSEGQEIERQLRVIEREIVDRRWSEAEQKAGL